MERKQIALHRRSPGAPRVRRIALWFGVWLCALAVSLMGPFSPKALAQGTVPQPPAWLEPRMMSIADFVGFVPESTLQNAILTYSTATGMATYISGKREYDQVEITVKVTPRYVSAGQETVTQIGCLGQIAVYDQWPAAIPPSKMRLYSNGQEITPAIYQLMTVPAGLVQPQGNSTEYYRYPYGASQWVGPASPLSIPANMGCSMTLPGRQPNLTAIFTVKSPAYIKPTYLGSETFNAHSYIGTGSTGVLDSLNAQMTHRFGTRHDKFTLSPISGADYALVVFPPTPLDPYAADLDLANAGLEGSGTYRLEGNGLLSVDTVNSLPLPIQGHWADDGYTPGAQFLKWQRDWSRLTSPEYFLPPGVPYDACMTNGGCSDDLLDTIYNTQYPLTVHYFHVERIPGSDLAKAPLTQVGPKWLGPSAAAVASSASNGIIPSAAEQQILTFLPWVSNLISTPLPPDDPAGCATGCGWFDYWGRMVDVILPP